MAGLFSSSIPVTFIDHSDAEIATIWDDSIVPRVGENVRIAKKPYIVERVGYDILADKIERIWIVVCPA